MIAIGKEPLVQIFSKGNVKQADVTNVLQSLKGAGINSITFKYIENSEE